tara:strand:- start:62 stop:253 length:192 start_codon:yes stop_codon:yes gene_type:complete
MAESTKFFRQKKGQWVWIFDFKTNRKKKVELQLLLDKINNNILDRKYFALKEERDKFAKDCRS